MRSRKQISQQLQLFYEEINNKRKNKTMRLQLDIEFQQIKMNDKFNVTMFATSIRVVKHLPLNKNKGT